MTGRVACCGCIMVWLFVVILAFGMLSVNLSVCTLLLRVSVETG